MRRSRRDTWGVATSAAVGTTVIGSMVYSSARRQPTDWLEGDTVLVALANLGHMWRGCVVPFNVDNSAFQRSAVKSWSRAERLAVQVRQLFMLQLDFGCVLEINWISTADNVFADARSRQDGHRKFLDLVSSGTLPSGLVEPLPPGTELLRDPCSGAISHFGPEYPSDVSGDGPSGRNMPFSMTVPYIRGPRCTSVFPTRRLRRRLTNSLITAWRLPRNCQS
eukprot:4882242-Pleurochrysis_carterae.AAC.1